MIYFNKDKMAQFKLDWYNYNKDEILELYPDCTYPQLKDRANRMKFRKNPDFIVRERLKKLMDDTLYNWYWRGFILGDGHIDNEGELKISLNNKDYEYLKVFSDYLNINIRNKTNYCHVCVKDAKYGIELRNMFKIDKPKTHYSCSLECIKTNEQLLALYIGLIDADGYLDKSMIRIQLHSSWLDNLNYIKNWLEKLGIDSVKTKIDKRGYAHLTVYRRKNIEFLFQFAKDNGLPYMQRKWHKLIDA